MPAKDGYRRIVIWQPSSGFALDVGAHHALQAATPSVDESYFRGADGSRRVRARQWSFELPAIRGDHIEHARLMKMLGCPVKMVALGLKRHEVWIEPSQLQLVESRRGFGQFAGETLRIESDIIRAAIWQSDDLLEGVPWNGAAYDAGFLSRASDVGYEGPLYAAPAGAFVSALGELVSGSKVTLTLELPIGGATLRFTDPADPIDFSGNIQAFDVSGNYLATYSDGVSFVLDEDAYSLLVSVSLANGRPQLLVEAPGAALDPRVGSLVFCSEAGAVVSTSPGGSGSQGANISVDCPEEVVLLDGGFSPQLEDDAAVVLSASSDGLAYFTKTVEDLGGYDFDITNVVFTLSGTDYGAEDGFGWVACDLACGTGTPPAGSGSGSPAPSAVVTSERDVEFQIQYAFIASGTYTVTITVETAACQASTVSFSMTK